MNQIYSLIPKKTRILIISLVVLIILLLIILLTNQPNKEIISVNPVISQTPSSQFSFQKTVIGQTTINNIENSYKVKNKQTQANGDFVYSIDSQLNARPDQVVFHNDLAQFERTVVITQKLKLSDLIIKYGQAERIIRGSKFYGYHADTYIYAKKGIAFIANTNTNEVYEIQNFTPTTVESYISNYGQDLSKVQEVKE